MRQQPSVLVWPATPLVVGGGTLIDSYSESNRSQDDKINSNSFDNSGIGQCFTGSGLNLGSCKFYLAKVGSPTGNLTVAVYAISGTFGTNAIPSGSALATADTVAASAIPTSQALVTFTFSGANQITLTNGTRYAVTCEYTSGDASNYILIADDATSPTHAGNLCFREISAPSWAGLSTLDTCFYVYST